MVSLLMFACVQTGLHEDKLAQGASSLNPDILVEPSSLTFEPMGPGASAVQTFTVTNTGAKTLSVSNMLLTGTSSFTVLDFGGPFNLDFGESKSFTVEINPVNPEEHGSLAVYSNDPGDPSTPVELFGTTQVPELLVSPNPYNFGKVPIDCTATGVLTLQNVGEAPLTVNSIVETAAQYGVDGETSLTIAPGEFKTVDITFTPPDTSSYQTQLWIDSNSIFGPQAVDLRGEGSKDGTIEDEFVQGDGPWTRTDIMVFVDESGSMDDDQQNLADNFHLFVDALASLSMDWQLAVATDDSGCHNGAFITDQTPNSSKLFLEDVHGPSNKYTEAGLTIADNFLKATGPGECNEGFLREDSKTMLILVSDEPEQSRSSWDLMVDSIKTSAPNASITSVVGDIPYGCLTAAAGIGYYEATINTGGAFLSICAPDWGDYFQTIANIAATGKTDTFVLSSRPDITTLVVTVNGVATAVGWTYDEVSNAIIFDAEHVPDSDSRITVTYELKADCGQ